MNETIKNLREQSGLSQAKVAEYLGVSRQMYIKYESGETEPSVSVVKMLASLYKVSVDFIIENKGKTDAEHKEVHYEIREKTLEVAEPGLLSFDLSQNRTFSADSLNFRNVSAQLKKLSSDELIKIASKALALVESKKKRRELSLSKNENLALFEKLDGCIKNIEKIDGRSEYISYLDQRYGV